MQASDLKSRARFYEPYEAVDEDGQVVQDCLLRFACAAHVRYLRGSEAVMQARLQSKAPAVVTIRDSADARQVTSEWRVHVDGRMFELGHVDKWRSQSLMQATSTKPRKLSAVLS